MIGIHISIKFTGFYHANLTHALIGFNTDDLASFDLATLAY